MFIAVSIPNCPHMYLAVGWWDSDFVLSLSDIAAFIAVFCDVLSVPWEQYCTDRWHLSLHFLVLLLIIGNAEISKTVICVVLSVPWQHYCTDRWNLSPHFLVFLVIIGNAEISKTVICVVLPAPVNTSASVSVRDITVVFYNGPVTALWMAVIPWQRCCLHKNTVSSTIVQWQHCCICDNLVTTWL
jgi:hypothetical protein